MGTGSDHSLPVCVPPGKSAGTSWVLAGKTNARALNFLTISEFELLSVYIKRIPSLFYACSGSQKFRILVLKKTVFLRGRVR